MVWPLLYTNTGHIKGFLIIGHLWACPWVQLLPALRRVFLRVRVAGFLLSTATFAGAFSVGGTIAAIFAFCFEYLFACLHALLQNSATLIPRNSLPHHSHLWSYLRLILASSAAGLYPAGRAVPFGLLLVLVIYTS